MQLSLTCTALGGSPGPCIPWSRKLVSRLDFGVSFCTAGQYFEWTAVNVIDASRDRIITQGSRGTRLV